jgi:hypothetical protein
MLAFKAESGRGVDGTNPILGRGAKVFIIVIPAKAGMTK